MDQPEILRIDLELDEELREAWFTCSERYPALGFSGIVRELLVGEARKSAGA